MCVCVCNTHLPLLFVSVTSRVVFSTCDPYSKIIFLNSVKHEVILLSFFFCNI